MPCRKPVRARTAALSLPYLREVSLKHEKDRSEDHYPFTIPAIKKLQTVAFGPGITFLIGENGTGKSTLLEALAVALGMNPEGGSRNFHFSTRDSHSQLWQYLRVVRSWSRPQDQYFLRAESFFNVATEIEALDKEPESRPIINAYGGVSLHECSHGESFFALIMNRFRGNGLYLLDEPEAALSPMRQLVMLRRIRDLIDRHSQFIIATHSPLLLAYPDALILTLDEDGFHRTAYRETQHYKVMKAFFDDPDAGIRRALGLDVPLAKEKQSA